MLNLSILAETWKPVVHCPEKWQAETLIKEFDVLLPGRVHLNAVNWWSFYRDETCYYVDIHVQDGDLKRVRFEYCRESWYKDSGYTVLEFNDVVFGTVDFGEISIDGADIKNLFCVG